MAISVNSINKVQFASSNKTNSATVSKKSDVQASTDSKKASDKKKKNKKAVLFAGAILAAIFAKDVYSILKGDGKIPLSILENHTFRKFKDKISKLPQEDSAKPIIEELFNKNNDRLNLNVIDYLVKNNKVNAENLEFLVNKIVKVEPQKNLDMEAIATTLSTFYKHLDSETLLGDKAVNTILKAVEKANVEVKLITYQSLVDDINSLFHYCSADKVGILSENHLKNIIKNLKDIDKKTFTHSPLGLYTKKVQTQDLKSKTVFEYFRIKNIDETLIKDFKSITADKMLTEEQSIELIEELGQKIPQTDNLSKNQNALLKELLLAFLDNRANSKDRFKIGYAISEKISYANSLEPELVFNVFKELKELANNRSLIGASRHEVYQRNVIEVSLLEAKKQLFIKEFNDNRNYEFEVVADFAREMLREFDSITIKAQTHEILCANYDKVWKLLKNTYKNFSMDMNILFLKTEKYVKGRCINKKEISRLKAKIEEYGKRYFNINFSSEETHIPYKGPMSSKRAFAEFLSTLKGFEEEAQMLRDSDFDKTMLKKIKRKFTLQFHPDRYQEGSASDVKSKAEAEAIFKVGFEYISTLEKLVK